MSTEELFEGWIVEQASKPRPCLQQGDLIVFSGSEDETKKYAIVVTADCDLEKKKHANLVTLIPVVAEKAILTHYLLPEDCEKKRVMIEDNALKKMNIEKGFERHIRIELLATKLSEASSENTTNELISKLLDGKLSQITPEEYVKLMEVSGGKPKSSKDLANQILDRGDLLLLPDAKKLGVDARIAWIRQVWQVPISDIALKTSQVPNRLGERIARLDSPFRYRLTQLMAQVFSDIGLPNIPDDVEKSVKDLLENA